MGHYIYKLNIVKTVLYEFEIKQAQYTVCPKKRWIIKIV